MPHIHTNPGQHDSTVTAYIINIDGPEPKALLHMHKKLGILLPIGGHIELNENSWQAIDHELVEESGYDITQLDLLQPPDMLERLSGVTLHPYPLVLNTHSITQEHFHSDIAFGFVTKETPNHSVHADESPDIRWYTHGELLALTARDIRLNTQEAYDFIFTVALPTWKQVTTEHF